MDLDARFDALQHLLDRHDALWRPRPFCTDRPAWALDDPELARAVRGLDDATVAELAADDARLRAWLLARRPELAPLAALVEVVPSVSTALPPCDAHFDWAIPGRKRAQIEAFAATVGRLDGPVLEWCAGKGHLGRRLAALGAGAIASLEIDPQLCAETDRLAGRAGRDQRAVCADALDPAAQREVAGRHVVALHACGELHRVLVAHAARSDARSFSIAPCCFDRGVGARYRAASAGAALALDAGDVRLAITGQVTASARERAAQTRERAFKLGFIALRRALDGTAYTPFRPVPAGWARQGFEGFCRLLAARESVALPVQVDWAHWEAAGWRRHGEVVRDELVRHAFRRALELWLVLDQARALAAAGFGVRVGTFCDPALTPRNLLIQASRG